jgi:hypothetical protein
MGVPLIGVSLISVPLIGVPLTIANPQRAVFRIEQGTVIMVLHLASPRQKVADHSSRYT